MKESLQLHQRKIAYESGEIIPGYYTLALHTSDPNLTPGITYGPWSTSGNELSLNTELEPWATPGVAQPSSKEDCLENECAGCFPFSQQFFIHFPIHNTDCVYYIQRFLSTSPNNTCRRWIDSRELHWIFIPQAFLKAQLLMPDFCSVNSQLC